MPKDLTFTRRQFVQGGAAFLSTVGTMPIFLGNTSSALAASSSQPMGNRPGQPEDRVLVVVQLSGGNDGLNTVIPYGEGLYYDKRPRIAIEENSVLKLDTQAGIGLHPALAPIKEMYDAGNAAVIQGVGYPNPNRSHFASMDVWHTGDTRGGKGVGWIGGAMDAHRKTKDKPLDATSVVSLGKTAPLAANGKVVKPVSFDDPRLFQWSGKNLHDSLGPSYDRINRAGVSRDAGDPDKGSQLAFVMRTALDAQIANDRILKALDRGTKTNFPSGELANQMKMVASMIAGGLPTRVYYVALGGFDTHSNQAFSHQSRLQLFAQAVNAFYKELKATGHDKRVLTMAFSEFGRRVAQNASNGTDHGTAGPMFLFGDMVKPGLHGKYPSLANLDSGDLIYNVDFRTVYSGILQDWMKIDPTAAMGKQFNAFPVLRA